MDASIDPTDETLMRQSLSGDLLAREKLAERFLPDIHRLCRYLLRNHSAVDDAVQECFLRVFRYLKRWDGRPPRPWILTIAYNRCVTLRQQAGRIRHEAFPGEPIHQAMQHESLVESELEKAITSALASIRPEFKDALVLHHVLGQSVEDVAIQMSVPLGTAKTWLSRGRKALWEILKSTGHVEGDIPRQVREDR